MSLSKLLPQLNNAGRRLILSEVLGEPVSIRIAKQRQSLRQRQDKEMPKSKVNISNSSSVGLASAEKGQQVQGEDR